MGLKTIHIAFIASCLILLGGTAAISFWEFWVSKRISLLFVGLACLATCAVLVPYSFHFMRKLKNIGYM